MAAVVPPVSVRGRCNEALSLHFLAPFARHLPLRPHGRRRAHRHPSMGGPRRRVANLRRHSAGARPRGATVDKTRYRLTANIAEDTPVLVKWTEWAAKNVTPATIRVLHEAAGSFETWYVYFGVIDPTAIEECVDMQTELIVEDWRDVPMGLVKPVPPDRRHAWHKKLIKKLRRQVRPA